MIALGSQDRLYLFIKRIFTQNGYKVPESQDVVAAMRESGRGYAHPLFHVGLWKLRTSRLKTGKSQISPDIESDKFGYWPLLSPIDYHLVIPVIQPDVPRLLAQMD